MSQTTSTPQPVSPISDRVVLRAKGIRRSFLMGEQEIQVLKQIDLSIHAGEFIAIEGRSGSGKSTLLHILGALDTVDDGKVEFEGQDYTRRRGSSEPWVVRFLLKRFLRRWMWLTLVLCFLGPLAYVVIDGNAKDWAEWSPAWRGAFVALWSVWSIWFVGFISALAIRLGRSWRPERIASRLRNEDFGFVFQFYHLLPELNVLENAMLVPMVEHGWFSFLSRRRELRDKATKLLTEFGLGHRLRHRPAQLSGGERQRVAIARALMNDPKVLFADEPTGNLDAETGSQIMGVLESLHRQRGQTIVMVTHDRTLARQADRTYVLKEGRLEKAQ